jgi:uncharacterized membrane protein YoaK (UPF0700 family)
VILVSAPETTDAAGTPAGMPAWPTARTMTIIAVLLTFASGASDVASFTRLGNVFTSVMTGNITVFGLSLARGSVSLAAHTGVAVAGYVAGVVIGTRLGWHLAGKRSAGPQPKPPGGYWPAHMTVTLLVEIALFCGVIVGWELTGSKPAGTAQFVILAIAACAMGIQSSAVNQMGLGNVSTTFLTGTLTGLVSSLARPDTRREGGRRPAILLGLLAGAVLAGVFLATIPDVVPALPLTALVTAVTLGSRGERGDGTSPPVRGGLRGGRPPGS